MIRNHLKLQNQSTVRIQNLKVRMNAFRNRINSNRLLDPTGQRTMLDDVKIHEGDSLEALEQLIATTAYVRLTNPRFIQD